MLIAVLSTADWDSAVWTNKQHIASRLANEGYLIAYIDSLGLRRPRLTRADASRIRKRLQAQHHARRVTPRQLQVVSPNVLPLHDYRFVQKLNRRQMHRLVRPILASDQENVLYTFSPITYDIEELFDRVIYHSVDLLHEFPSVPRRALLGAERTLLKRADFVAASSRPIVEHLKEQGAHNVAYWPNVADVELYKAHWGERRNRAVFAGNLTPSKVNLQWLLALAARGTKLEIAGPRGVDGADSSLIDDLLAHPGVTYHGNLAAEPLAKLMGSCTVGVIPYLRNSYTAGVFPMKIAEYIAAGLHVVSTDLPALRQEEMPGTSLVTEEYEFVECVSSNIGAPCPKELRLRASSIDRRSWDARLEEIRHVLRGWK